MRACVHLQLLLGRLIICLAHPVMCAARRGAARRVHVQTSTRVMHNNRFKGNTVRRMSGREREGKTW
jgi:hypothetical protein